MIAIVDYDVGNVASIANMLSKIGAKSMITRDFGALREAEKIILPGVGAFDTAVKNLHEFGLFDVLNDIALVQRKPVLGVCLGAQLVGKRSEEGKLPGFGWLDFELKRFQAKQGERLRVPHMGWNVVRPSRPDIGLFAGVPSPMRFYFVHTFYMEVADPALTLASAFYGQDFTCVVGKDNIVATQFHPEKSHKYGMSLYRSFVEGAVLC